MRVQVPRKTLDVRERFTACIAAESLRLLAISVVEARLARQRLRELVTGVARHRSELLGVALVLLSEHLDQLVVAAQAAHRLDV